jgi:hypothetical protein
MQKLRPREVDVLTYPNETHMTFGASSLRLLAHLMEVVPLLKRGHSTYLTYPLLYHGLFMYCGLISRVCKEIKAFILLGILLGKYCYFNEKGARSLI